MLFMGLFICLFTGLSCQIESGSDSWTQIINYQNNVKAFKCMSKFNMQVAKMKEKDNSYWSQ